MQRQKEVEDVKEQEKYEEEYFVRLGGRKRRKDSGREMAEKSLEELMDFGGLSNEKVTRVMCLCLCLSVCLSNCTRVLDYDTTGHNNISVKDLFQVERPKRCLK